MALYFSLFFPSISPSLFHSLSLLHPPLFLFSLLLSLFFFFFFFFFPPFLFLSFYEANKNSSTSLLRQILKLLGKAKRRYKSRVLRCTTRRERKVITNSTSLCQPFLHWKKIERHLKGCYYQRSKIICRPFWAIFKRWKTNDFIPTRTFQQLW